MGWEVKGEKFNCKYLMEIFQVMKMLYILIMMVVTQLYTSFKTQMIHFKLVNFSVCKITTKNYVLSCTEEVEWSVHTTVIWKTTENWNGHIQEEPEKLKQLKLLDSSQYPSRRQRWKSPQWQSNRQEWSLETGAQIAPDYLIHFFPSIFVLWGRSRNRARSRVR